MQRYPLVMVHAEKIVTAAARGTVNTRRRSLHRVARQRQVELVPLARALDSYGEIAQGPVDDMEKTAAVAGPSSRSVRRGGLGRRQVLRSHHRRYGRRSRVGSAGSFVVIGD